MGIAGGCRGAMGIAGALWRVETSVTPALVSAFEQRVIRRERLGVRRFQAEEFEIDELASFGEVRGRSRLQAKGRDARSPERSVDLHYPLLVHTHPVGNDSPHGSVDAGSILAAREKHDDRLAGGAHGRASLCSCAFHLQNPG